MADFCDGLDTKDGGVAFEGVNDALVQGEVGFALLGKRSLHLGDALDQAVALSEELQEANLVAENLVEDPKGLELFLLAALPFNLGGYVAHHDETLIQLA